ncbi:Methionyl-tRNA formyltransferase [Rhodotorula sphaerocarpa]
MSLARSRRRLPSRTALSSWAPTASAAPYSNSYTTHEKLVILPDLFAEVTVVTPPDQRIGRRGREIYRPRLRLLAEELGVPVIPLPEGSLLTGWQPPEPFQTLSPDNLLLTASFGHLLPTSLLERFLPLNALNVHPSLLPRWRGAAPIQWSILAGDVDGQSGYPAGVSVQELSRGRFDRGRLLAQEPSPSAPAFADFCALERLFGSQGGRLLVSTLTDLPAHQAAAREQAADGGTHARKLARVDARIDWGERTAEEVCRRQRAFGHQHPLWTPHGDSSVQLVIDPAPLPDSASSSPSPPGSVSYDPQTKRFRVACATGEGAVAVVSVKRAGGKWVEAREWWNAVRRGREGVRFG